MSLDHMLIILGLFIALPNAIQSALDVLRRTER